MKGQGSKPRSLMRNFGNTVENLSDVKLTNVSTDDVLAYQESTNSWRNLPIAAAVLNQEFINLNDCPNSYAPAVANDILRVNAAKNAVEFSGVAITRPNLNQLQLSSGTTQLVATADATIDQDIQKSATPTFNDVTLTSLNTTVSSSFQLSKTNGFDATNAALLTFSIVNGATPTFTIAGGPYDYYQNSVKYTRTTDTIPISDTQGMHFVFYNGTILTESLTFDISFIRDVCAVAMFYWQKNANPALSKYLFLGRESHGFMPWQTHYLLHNTLGCQWESGLALDGFTIGNGSLNSHCQFGCSSGGTIIDEDIIHTITGQNSPATITCWFRIGTAWWSSTSADFAIMTSGTGRLGYNLFSSPNWAVSEVTNGKYAIYHVFATNSAESNNKLITIMGENEYQTLPAARIGANQEISNLQLFGLPTPEWVAIGSIILQTDNTYANNAKSKIVLTDTGTNYVNWIQKKALNASSSPFSHHNLSDLPTYDDHSQYVKTATVAPTDSTLAVWDTTSGRLLKGTGINWTTTGNLSSVGTLGVTNTITSSLKTTGGNAQILNFDNNNDAGSWSYLGPSADMGFGKYTSGASGNAMLISSLTNVACHIGSNVGDAFKINNGATPLGDTILFYVNHVGGVYATNTITSLTPSGAYQTFNFDAGPTLGDYSYFGPNIGMSFGIRNDSGIHISSDNYFQARVGNYFGVNSGPAPDGNTPRFHVYANGDGIDLGTGQKINEFSTDTTFADNSDLAIPTERAIKTYVDAKLVSGSHSTNFNGPWATQPSCAISYSLLHSKLVTLTFDAVSVATDSSTGAVNITVLPANLRPSATIKFIIQVIDSSAFSYGHIYVLNDGTVSIGNGAASPFTNSGNCGWDKFSISYNV